MDAQTQDIAPYYQQLSGDFEPNNTELFKGIEIKPLWLLADTSGTLNISEIRNLESGLLWKKASDVKPKRNTVYWLKSHITARGSTGGKFIFQLVEELGNDLHAYDYIDTYSYNQQQEYVHQRAGRKITVEERPVEFWANLIEFKMGPEDSLDVFIRVEGMNLSYPIESFSLWHLDFEDLFKCQLLQVRKAYLFYGILGIQILFFFFLYLIEKELIYISFSVFGLGMLLTRAFTEFNFASYVPLPQLVNYNELLFHLSVYLTVMGGLFFISQYLNIPKNSSFIKRIIPLYSVVTLISYLRFIFRYSFSEGGSFPLLLTPAPYTFIGIFLGIYMTTITPSGIKRTKIWIALAILPVVLGSCLILLNNDAHLTMTLNEEWMPEFLNKRLIDDVLSIGVILLVMTLSLNVGFRSLNLKKEKNAAIQESLNAQQTIFEKQLRAEKLQEMDDLKTKLYTNITHEFRTPLTVIMGINDELTHTTKQLSLPTDKKEKILQNQQLIHRNSENLLTLVNQLLDLSKSDSQQLDLQLIQGDIISYLNYLTESFYSKAKEKDLRLVFYSEQPSLIMDYDEQKIQHIAYNLLSNAIKFTPENGKIVMHATKTERENQSCLLLVVKDNGIGIASDHLPHIFDRFYQVDDSHTRHVDGSGIGLSLTKEMVSLMGGDISVGSQLGAGTTFTIHIPITNLAETSHSLHSIQPTHSADDLVNEASEPAKEVIDPADEKPILLIAEDNRDVFSYLKMVLGQTYQIIEAVNGEQGINKAIEYVPDLIVSDVMMPIKDGYQLTKTLKADTRTSHIPIILLTAKASEIDRLAGLKIGADAYLSKPFNKEELLIRIDQLLEVRNRLRHHYSSLYDPLKTEENAAATAPQAFSNTKIQEEEFLQQLHSTIQRNIKHESLGAESLAHALKISQSQLYRKVKALTGLSINNYINKIRLQKSLELLEDPEKNIAEIAYEVGFSSPNYYTRSFHKLYKKSPLTYRKATDKNNL